MQHLHPAKHVPAACTHRHHKHHHVIINRHVAEPYTRRYSQWALQHLLGRAGTEGSYNRALYLFGVSARAEQPRDLEAAYRALSQLPQQAKQAQPAQPTQPP